MGEMVKTVGELKKNMGSHFVGAVTQGCEEAKVYIKGREWCTTIRSFQGKNQSYHLFSGCSSIFCPRL